MYNEVSESAVLYNAGFPPELPEEKKQHCEALPETIKKIAAKALIP